MTSPLIESFEYVKITLKSLIDGSTKVINLSTRPMIDQADGVTKYWPLARTAQNVGSELGEFVPEARGGSLLIDNRPGKFGYERKFSDLFRDYACYGAVVEFYSAQLAVDDTSINSQFALDWRTFGVKYSFDGDMLKLDLAQRGLSNKVLTKVIDGVGFSNPPAASIGKHLPIIFGDNIPVRPALISVGATPQWAYGTNFGTTFTNSGINGSGEQYLAKDHLGEYQNVTSPATTSDALFQNTANNTSVQLVGFNLAFGLALASSTCYILRGGLFTLIGTGVAGAVTGQLEFKLLEGNSATLGTPDDSVVIASAIVNKADYSAQYQASANFNVEFSFNRPGVMRAGRVYWLSVSGSNELTSSATFLRYNSTGGTVGLCQKAISSADGNSWKFAGTSAIRGTMEFYGVVFTDSPAGGAVDSSGLGHSYFTASQKAAATGQTNPDLSKLDLVVVVNGIKDDGAGTITGSLGQVIRAPQHVIKTLDLQYDGSSWTTTGAQIDLTAFATTLSNHGASASTSPTIALPRQIGGYTEGRKTVSEIMRDVCRSSAFRIGRYSGSTKPFTLYAWGTPQPSVAVLTDEDSKILSVKQLGPEAVINRVVMQYFKDVRNADILQGAQSGLLKGYNYTLVYDVAIQWLTAWTSGRSVELYGRNELSDSTFEFISGAWPQFADSIAQYYLLNYASQSVFVELEVPKVKYRTLDNFRVIDILNPALPSTFGSSPNAKEHYCAGVNSYVTPGQHRKRAQRYRAQIEGKWLNNFGNPSYRLNARLLLNGPNDPT